MPRLSVVSDFELGRFSLVQIPQNPVTFFNGIKFHVSCVRPKENAT